MGSQPLQPLKPKDNRPLWAVIVGVIVIVVLAVLFFGCVEVHQDLVQGPTSTQSPLPSPAASFSPPVAPPVATVNVVEFTGREVGCGSGATMPVGCRAILTCTPRAASGADVGDSYNPTWAEHGAVSFAPTSTNDYNGRLTCEIVGQGAVSCTVGGTSGVFTMQCI